MLHWVYLLLGVGFRVVALPLVRACVVAYVSLWCLRADEPGRKHALELLRVLLRMPLS